MSSFYPAVLWPKAKTKTGSEMTANTTIGNSKTVFKFIGNFCKLCGLVHSVWKYLPNSAANYLLNPVLLTVLLIFSGRRKTGGHKKEMPCISGVPWMRGPSGCDTCHPIDCQGWFSCSGWWGGCPPPNDRPCASRSCTLSRSVGQRGQPFLQKRRLIFSQGHTSICAPPLEPPNRLSGVPCSLVLLFCHFYLEALELGLHSGLCNLI